MRPQKHLNLSFISPRITKRIQQARNAAMLPFIMRLRILLLAVSAAVLVLIFVWSSMLPDFTLSKLTEKIPNLVIENLRYSGMDSKKQPFSLFAAQATKPMAFESIYDLTDLEGEITLQNGTWLDGKAQKGRFDKSSNELWLTGNVNIFRDDGFQVKTEEAYLNINDKIASGIDDVSILGPYINIHGKGFNILDSGDTVIISGPVKAVFTNRK
ncbi:MAG: LPS export ABC transporter periplasmic protein LptC [Alphaproteobacteria bacterium]|nr:LPS export ABC transporter periplasmic protein LptC [Alphaproteobacteria bacterium]MCL2504636.1 LPS export ABC transporter periplasmic protein LptC [Alphaproteobacteria bacterium]